MRRIILGTAAFLGLLGASSTSQAQFTNNLNDPFYQYYAWFLPRQAAMASQPRSTDTINAIAAARGESSIQDRAGLYTPSSPFGLDSLDAAPMSGRSQRQRWSLPTVHRANSAISANVKGRGDPVYHNRGIANYYPGHQTAVSRVPVARGTSGTGGRQVPGMPGMPGGFNNIGGR